jgi:hypothetical protein
MPNLFPTFEMPELVEDQQPVPEPEYPESYLFDFKKGNFVLDGAGQVVEADGHTAWAQWCVKTVLTERFAFLAYSWDYGVEIEEALKNPNRAAIEAEVERTITEALMLDPRTELVRDFSFRGQADELYVSFTVVPVIGEAVRIEEVRLRGV